MERNTVIKMLDGTALERVIARSWLDADDGKWPPQNSGQCRSLIDEAIRELKKLMD